MSGIHYGRHQHFKANKRGSASQGWAGPGQVEAEEPLGITSSRGGVRRDAIGVSLLFMLQNKDFSSLVGAAISFRSISISVS